MPRTNPSDDTGLDLWGIKPLPDESLDDAIEDTTPQPTKPDPALSTLFAETFGSTPHTPAVEPSATANLRAAMAAHDAPVDTDAPLNLERREAPVSPIGDVASHELDRMSRRLSVLEDQIERSAEAMRSALYEIHDRRLYRAAGFDSFRAYLSERWGISRSQGYRLLDWERVERMTIEARASVSPIGDVTSLPEAHAREMAALRDDPEGLREVAEAHARGDLRTAADVRDAVRDRSAATAPSPPQTAAPVSSPAPAPEAPQTAQELPSREDVLSSGAAASVDAPAPPEPATDTSESPDPAKAVQRLKSYVGPLTKTDPKRLARDLTTNTSRALVLGMADDLTAWAESLRTALATSAPER